MISSSCFRLSEIRRYEDISEKKSDIFYVFLECKNESFYLDNKVELFLKERFMSRWSRCMKTLDKPDVWHKSRRSRSMNFSLDEPYAWSLDEVEVWISV